MSTLIVSDIHLGAKNSLVDRLAACLDKHLGKKDNLILNGDVIDNLNFKRFTREHWDMMRRFQSLVKEGRLTLMRGNHDEECRKKAPPNKFDILPKLLDTHFIDEFSLECIDGTYLVLHGHIFDPTLSWPFITDVADWFYQKAIDVNRDASKWLKKKAKKFGGLVDLITRRAISHAKQKKCQGVIIGHTHFPDDKVEIDGFQYLNSGSWVEAPGYFIKIDDYPVLFPFED